ncbi:MAG: formylglycine-generating enzyme family protein [Dehalococcoidia bacterium]
MRGRRKTVLPFSFFKMLSTVFLVVMLVTSFAGCSDEDTSLPEKGTPSHPKSPIIEMVYIPGGSFEMGNLSGAGDSDEKPVHPVTLSPYEMAKFEVTYAEWTVVKDWAESNGYVFNMPGDMGSGDYGGTQDENHPVTDIEWYDAVLWCNALSELEERTPCYSTSSAKTTVYRSGQTDIKNGWVDWEADGYRLPTEAEWEYACRANTTTKYSFGDNIDGEDANFWDSGDRWDNGTTPVGHYHSNDYGLYDMPGNVYEWCWDWYGEEYYKDSPANDPKGSPESSFRVLRGGSWYYIPISLRSANRAYVSPDNDDPLTGFRPVRSI